MWILRTNLRPVSPAGQALRTKRGKRFTGITNALTHWVPVFSPILPLGVVVDVHEEAAKNPDYTFSLERVKKWEKDHGQIPSGAFVAMRTDWSKRWPDAAKMGNKDAHGVAHYPDWSLPALKYLYEDRKITASGHETTDTDPGIATTERR